MSHYFVGPIFHQRFRLGLIHHSDHGTQYTSRVYRDTLLANHAQPSMGAVGNCYDNIFAERLIGILKDEYLLDVPFVEYTVLVDRSKPKRAFIKNLYL